MEKVSGQNSQTSNEETEYSEVSFLESRVSDSDVKVAMERVKDLLEGCQQKLLEI